MNKLFSKLGSLLLGVSLIVAGGVSLSSKGVSEAKATNYVPIESDSLDVTDKAYGTNNYTSETAYGNWTIKYGSNNSKGWAFFKMGGKAATLVTNSDTKIYSTVASSKQVDQVIVHGPSGSLSKNGMSVNSWKLTVYSDSALSTVVDTVDGDTSKITNNEWSQEFYPTSGITWAQGSYFEVSWDLANSTTTNGIVCVDKITLSEESSTPRGEISIDDNILNYYEVDGKADLSYVWTPASGSDATIVSYSWSSSDSEVVSIAGDEASALKPGVVTISLMATDSNSQVYNVESHKVYVTNSYDFIPGDNVVLYCSAQSYEFSGISTTTTKYGTAASYSGEPTGVGALSVEEGTIAGSFAFLHKDKYLTWTSGNSLNENATKSDNTSWFLVNYGEHYEIYNAADGSRQIFFNLNGGTDSRFACYMSKGINSDINLKKVSEVPVRGSIEITGPVDKTMRGDASGDLTYQWTPNAEATDVVISSHTWTSSNPEVIAVDGDTYNAVGAGKAKLTLNATDSTGQEYTVIGNEIEVINVVSGDYIKKMSVAIGDIVTLVCEADSTQIGGIDSNIGTYVFYNSKPASVFDFVLEAGSADNSYAFKTGDDKYLAWSSDAKVALVDEVNEKASWTISFNDIGDATIQCVALDGDAGRQIMWNHNSPRFAAYKSGQTAIQLYGQYVEPVVPYDATHFAQDLINLTNEQCSAYGTDSYDYETSKDIFATLWETLSGASYYGKLSDEDILLLEQAEAKEDSEDVLEVAMYRYDLITAKYSLDSFIGTRVVPTFSFIHDYESSVSSSNTIGIVVIVAVSSMTLLGVTLVLRKRKHQ